MPRCISPLLIRTAGRRDVVPCGRCNFCLSVKRADWSFRLTQELKVCKSSYFLTLTYDNEHVPFNPLSGLPELSKRDYQLFTKLLRKKNSLISDWPLRYYAVGEYGTQTARPHYHALMFNLVPALSNSLAEIWGKGSVDIGKVEPASIHYVTKYVINKTTEYIGREPPFAFMSKRPGIGANYIETHKRWHRADMRNYTKVNGQTARLPRYYKDKFFTNLEKAKLAQEAIDISDQSYYDEVHRLAAFHHDPLNYYDEATRQKHDSITSKINSTNTF